MPEPTKRALPHGAVLVRNIRPDDIRATGAIKKQAFIPRANGKDEDGLSVSEPLEDSIDQLCARTLNQHRCFGKLHAGSVRGIEGGGANPLDVMAAPTITDGHHALITGMPRLADRQSSDAAKALTERLAESLAKIAAVYTPPTA